MGGIIERSIEILDMESKQHISCNKLQNIPNDDFLIGSLGYYYGGTITQCDANLNCTFFSNGEWIPQVNKISRSNRINGGVILPALNIVWLPRELFEPMSYIDMTTFTIMYDHINFEREGEYVSSFASFAVISDSSIFIIGDYTLKSTYIFNFVSNTYTQKSDLNSRRGKSNVGVTNGKVIVHGGTDYEYNILESTESYNLEDGSDEWITLSNNGPSINEGRIHKYKEELYLIGGRSNYFDFSQYALNEIYKFNGIGWDLLNDFRLQSSRSQFATIPIPKSLVTFNCD